MKLSGKVAVIMGANSVMGRAIALRLAREGASIVLQRTTPDDDISATIEAVHTLGRNVFSVEADVSREADVQSMVAKIMQQMQHIDILINNASADMFSRNVDDMTDEERLKRALARDVKGTFLCCRAVIPVMQAQGSGSIISMSWDAALVEGMDGAGTTLYAAAMGAIHGLSLSLARELAPQIRVNVIAPGALQTYGDAAERALTIPMKRTGDVEDVTEAVVYLASSAAAYITGQTIVVNGGRIMY